MTASAIANGCVLMSAGHALRRHCRRIGRSAAGARARHGCATPQRAGLCPKLCRVDRTRDGLPVSPAVHRKTLPLPCVATAFVAAFALCVSTASVAKDTAFGLCFHCLRGRLCLAFPLPSWLKTPPFPRGPQVPLFQRKYCWERTQWAALWRDIRSLAASPTHYLGKLMLYEETGASELPTAAAEAEAAAADGEYVRSSCYNSARNGMARAVRASALMVCDGQQRLTTCCVLLAAIRDAGLAAAAAAAGGPAAAEAAEALRGMIDPLLFDVPPPPQAGPGAHAGAEGTSGCCGAAPAPGNQGEAARDELLEWGRAHARCLPVRARAPSVGSVLMRAAGFSVKSAQAPCSHRQARIKTIRRGSDRVGIHFSGTTAAAATR